jgi:hypothetical protein|tara:strand:+ start:963 stop:1199 length:237 start_codon:yes stop_codon:yes gene_type:complete
MKQKEKQIIEQVVYQMIHGYYKMGLPIQNTWEIIDDDLEEMIDGELWNEDFKMESSIKEQLKQAHESFDKVLEEYENE